MLEVSDIGVVIVTYNRLGKLKKTLELFSKQSLYPKYIIVVDNCCDDGSDIFLDEWKHRNEPFSKYIISLKENTGGSGGFYEGLRLAESMDAEWIWLSDDDAYPTEIAIETTDKSIKELSGRKPSAICGKILDPEGNIIYSHRKQVIKKLLNIKLCPYDIKDYSKDYFKTDLFSYVGTVINKSCLEKAGLPERDFFIWYDDTEHSMRLSKIGDIYCVPDIEIIHDEQDRNNVLDWRWYYGVRNEIFMIKKHFSFPYFAFFLLKRTFRAVIKIMKKNTRESGRIELLALNDGINARLGKHDKYKPGWKPIHDYSQYK